MFCLWFYSPEVYVSHTEALFMSKDNLTNSLVELSPWAGKSYSVTCVHKSSLVFILSHIRKTVHTPHHSSLRSNLISFRPYQRWPTSGPRLDFLRPPPSHRFGSIGESLDICLILLVQRKIWTHRFKCSNFFMVCDCSVWGEGAILPGCSSERNTGSGPWWYSRS
jgi:hypothetical protein